MSAREGIDRRTFLKSLGGGIVVFISLGKGTVFSQDRRRVYPDDINAYLLIGENGRVTVYSGKIEMGQGVLTSQAQMAAEELGVALDSIDMILGDTSRCPWDRGTFGSLTTRVFGPALRAAAAEARAVLVALAAKKLGVPEEQLVVEGGVVSVKGAPQRKVSYAELAQGKSIARIVDKKGVLRSVSEMTVMGRSPRRLDGVEKVTGAARYAGDIRLPGMLYARVLRPPAHGAKAGQIDTSAAEKVAGVTVVKKDDLVAVLHADPEAAGDALELVKADWQVPEAPFDSESVFDHVLKNAPEPETPESRGDVTAARKGSARVFESEYRKGYVAHAPMEPHTSIAEVKDGKATVWASTQTPFPLQEQVAKTLGFELEAVRVVTPYVGGGFGGKSAGLQSLEAARLAQITGKPVQVAWTRQEEFFYDTFDPACVVKVASAVDGSGRITFWDFDVYCAGDRGAEVYYDIPNARVRVRGSWRGSGTDVHLFGVGPWRAPGANMNCFARESQIDEMAAAARVDPLEFRLRNLKDPRMQAVLKAAAEAAAWQAAPGPSGKGRAIACGIDAGTYVALVAQVKVDPSEGSVKVDRVVCAQDMGLVVNPNGAKMQMEGCIAMGLGYVFAEELRFRGGEILDRNFGTYHLPRFSWVPRIETVLVKNDELAPQGGGEPAIVPMGAVVANAVFDATGARVRRLPMIPERVLAALRNVNEGDKPRTSG
jgi:CO/xanthine dehydrogenase Mo-binding subunit